MKRGWVGLVGCLGLLGCDAAPDPEQVAQVTQELGNNALVQVASPYWVDLFDERGKPARRLDQHIYTSSHIDEEEEGEEGEGDEHDEHDEEEGEEEPSEGELRPIVTPDGRHLRLDEFSQVRGKASVKCKANGSQVQIDLSGLVPGGTYSLWNIVYKDPGYNGQTEHNIIGFGALGKKSGTENTFRASRKGTAKVNVFNPAGPLSALGQIGPCPATTEFDWLILGVYHLDPFSGGPRPGPLGSGAGQFAFDYAN
jgi:hypothetical protein